MKTLKRICFGLRSFTSYRTRVLLYPRRLNRNLLATLRPPLIPKEPHNSALLHGFRPSLVHTIFMPSRALGATLLLLPKFDSCKQWRELSN
jgi:hypothetical protein